MNITKDQLKQVIREELEALKEKETGGSKKPKSDKKGEAMPKNIRRLPSRFVPKEKPEPKPESREAEGEEAKSKRETEGSGEKRKGSWLDAARRRRRKANPDVVKKESKQLTQKQLAQVIREELQGLLKEDEPIPGTMRWGDRHPSDNPPRAPVAKKAPNGRVGGGKGPGTWDRGLERLKSLRPALEKAAVVARGVQPEDKGFVGRAVDRMKKPITDEEIRLGGIEQRAALKRQAALIKPPSTIKSTFTTPSDTAGLQTRGEVTPSGEIAYSTERVPMRGGQSGGTVERPVGGRTPLLPKTRKEAEKGVPYTQTENKHISKQLNKEWASFEGDQKLFENWRRFTKE